MDQPTPSESQRTIAEFLAMVEQLYFENYSLRQILDYSKLPDGSPAIPNWKNLLNQHLSNDLLKQTIHRTKFGPLFEKIHQATRAEVVDEVLRSIQQSTEKNPFEN